MPVGSLLGFLAFRQRDRQASRVEQLSREVESLRQELAALKIRNASGELPQISQEPVPEPEPTSEMPADNPPPHISVPPPRRLSLETRLINALKANWMVWLGGLSVSLAGIFMVSHSINAGLIGPVQQFTLACLLYTSPSPRD